MAMKNTNDTIGNRTRAVPTCSAVPQPTALPQKNQLDTKFSSFLNITLHVSDGLSVHHQEFKTVHTTSGICHTV
jgi:hypothetical protein